MKVKYVLLLVVSSFFLISCAHSVRNSNQYMAIPVVNKEHFPSSGKALLIVERTQELNLAAYNMIVWDVTERLNPGLIGYLAPGMKAAYELDPGKHTLLLQLAATNNAMKITVEAGKTYFTKIGTRGYGAYFFPIKNGDENDISRSDISAATDYLVQWGLDRERIENSLQVRIDKGLGKWEKMSAKEMAARNIDVADGR